MYILKTITFNGRVCLKRDQGCGQMWVDIIWLAEDANLLMKLQSRDIKLINYWIENNYLHSKDE